MAKEPEAKSRRAPHECAASKERVPTMPFEPHPEMIIHLERRTKDDEPRRRVRLGRRAGGRSA